MAQQPLSEVTGSCAFVAVTGQLAALLFYRSCCDRQGHLASQETWVRKWG
jgi:hypothetical protein